jgi:hypothetical protein
MNAGGAGCEEAAPFAAVDDDEGEVRGFWPSGTKERMSSAVLHGYLGAFGASEAPCKQLENTPQLVNVKP